ncbi:MAG TPA: ATP-binding protein, partial [Kofleriaceae bacterium]
VRRTLASDLAQVQRLEAVGRLAAGIAHEINTPIQFVGDNLVFVKEATADLLELLRHYQEMKPLLPAPEAERMAALEDRFDLEYLKTHMVEALESSAVGLATVATLVRTMKVFAHPDGHRKEPADINQALLSASVISAGEYKLVAEVKTSFGEIPLVSCYAGELNQVFLNIIVNAAHAIQEVVGSSGKRGTITIATSVDGAFVVIAISDTGAGIPEAVRSRIFDPFFTTKDVGKGSGQGLAISNKIVEKHGGALTFETELGKGTTFFVRVPIAG